MNTKVLVIENDKDLREYIEKELLEEGYEVKTIKKGLKYESAIDDFTPDLIVLDWDLSLVDGTTICDDVSDLYPNIPIIVISSNENIQELLSAFRCGALDFITKPFNIRELIVRMKARLHQLTRQDIYKAGNLTIDDSQKRVTVSGKTIDLSKREYDLLLYLIMHKNQVVSRDMILNHVWGTNEYIEERVVDVYIGYLRKKLKEDADFEIETVRGFGYRIRE